MATNPLFDSFSAWSTHCQEQKVPLYQPVLTYEQTQRGLEKEAIFQKIKANYQVMCEAIHTGLSKQLDSPSGMVQGGGKKVAEWPTATLSKEFQLLVARALAAKELNACMGRVVAAPTAGASGILPAVLYTLQEQHNVPEEKLLEAILVAAGAGLVIEHRASISGAIGGCQAETGSAAAMGAAAIVYVLSGDVEETFNAVAITIQCMLGLVCDPVAGLVEVPCVVRNASAAAIAFSSAQIALARVSGVIPVDECVDAMAEVAQSMETRYKETAEGGLAATPTARDITQKVFGKTPTSSSS